MCNFVAKRLRLRNERRFSFLGRPGKFREVTFHLARFCKRGRAANAIHAVRAMMALLYRELDKAGILLLRRLALGVSLDKAVQYRERSSCKGEFLA